THTPTPLCMPLRSRRSCERRWRMRKLWTACSSARDIRATSCACCTPLRTGRPDTTIYASPIVSTWGRQRDGEERRGEERGREREREAEGEREREREGEAEGEREREREREREKDIQ